MCGIAGVWIKDPRSKQLPGLNVIEGFIDALLLGIEPRGHDATGFVSVQPGAKKARLEKADITAQKFVSWRKPIGAGVPRMTLLHTRLSTKGSPKNLDNNHPVRYNSTYAIHNGVIFNDDELFASYKFPRRAEVDTEIIPALFDKYGMDKAHLALQELDGNFAVAVCDPKRFPDQLILAKGPRSPLEYFENDFAIVWASTKSAIQDAYQHILDIKIDASKIKSLGYGDILYLSPGKKEEFRFKVYTKPYVYKHSPSNRTHGYSYGFGDILDGDDDDAAWAAGWNSWNGRSTVPSRSTQSSPNRRDLAFTQELCECGETRFWHAGMNYDGSCLRARSNCERFRSKGGERKDLTPGRSLVVYRGGERHEYVACVSCRNMHSVDELEKLQGFGSTLICKRCLAREETEPIDVAVDTTIVEEDDFDSQIIEKVADALGFTEDFVQWILFEAEDDDFDNNQWALSAYIAVDDLYSQHLKEARAQTREAADDSCGVQTFEGMETA